MECDIGKLDDERTKKELELDDVESFISDITAVAYHKACEDMIDDVTENVRTPLKKRCVSWRKWCKSGVVAYIADKESVYLSNIAIKHLKFVIYQVCDEL